MHDISLASAAFLFVVVAVLPAMAFKGARKFKIAAATSHEGTRPRLTIIYLNSLVMLATILALAWLSARTFAYHLFVVPHFGARELLAGVAALGAQFALQYLSVVVRTPDERRTMPVNRMMPRSAGERALYSVLSITAGVVEEAAYRGVLMSILWYLLGNVWAAAGISALAFAAGHAVQGWKSMAVIFVMACSMHALVWYTGTLVVAMAVHAIYDLCAPTLRRRIWPAPPTAPERIAG